jgi:hypothetical protein
MYVRISTRRRVYRVGLLLVALVVLAPKLDFTAAPQLTEILHAMGLGQPPADQFESLAASASACITDCRAPAG